PVGYQEAFSFNLLIGGKAVYDKKTGTLTLYIPQAYQKAGRTYAILGVNQTGKATVFTDTDQDSTKITINLNDIEGYAFSLIYSD
ncbi:MAG: hypothetical protein Q4G60_08980, partial [bacterium]|nr:hypothetical protein [bacterium]